MGGRPAAYFMLHCFMYLCAAVFLRRASGGLAELSRIDATGLLNRALATGITANECVSASGVLARSSPTESDWEIDILGAKLGRIDFASLDHELWAPSGWV